MRELDSAAETFGVEPIRTVHNGYLASCGLERPAAGQRAPNHRLRRRDAAHHRALQQRQGLPPRHPGRRQHRQRDQRIGRQVQRHLRHVGRRGESGPPNAQRCNGVRDLRHLRRLRGDARHPAIHPARGPSRSTARSSRSGDWRSANERRRSVVVVLGHRVGHRAAAAADQSHRMAAVPGAPAERTGQAGQLAAQLPGAAGGAAGAAGQGGAGARRRSTRCGCWRRYSASWCCSCCCRGSTPRCSKGRRRARGASGCRRYSGTSQGFC